MEGFKLNERLELAFNYLFYTGRNVFLTGKAGTGKTTFLKQLKKKSPKRMIVTSPTGVAAVNAGGVTLHSFFQLPLGPQIPGTTRQENRKFNFQKNKIDIIRSLELLVIDEISMVRADLLDSVDSVLKRYRQNDKPFGGVQLLLIGDMQQLSPVVRDEDAEILRPYYQTYYFFGSKAWQQTDYVCIELNEVFRQADQTFVSILNEIREAKASEETLNKLNQRYIPNFKPKDGEDIVTLVTTNQQAERINQMHLLQLNTPFETFEAEVTGDFPESAFPIERSLRLKKDSVVMFLKNDPSPSKEFYNGKIGRIIGFEDGAVLVKCNNQNSEIKVSPLVWENIKYTVNPTTKEITETVVGSFKQIPLKTAWAVTIHKSQGLTFDKLMIDASNSFAHGQVYVALSRCRTLEGLILLKKLSSKDLIYDYQVNSFSRTVEEKTPNQQILLNDKREYFFSTVEDLFDFSPIFNALKTLQRQIDLAGHSVYGNYTTIQGLDSLIYEQLMIVSEKFLKIIRQKHAQELEIEKDQALLTRIHNGCKYFLEKFDSFLSSGIEDFDFVCDDKAKSDKISESSQTLMKNYKFKKSMLEFCQNTFSILEYYSQKAKLSVSDNVSTSKTNIISNNKNTIERKIFDNLVSWRKEIAQSLSVEEKEIIHSKTLEEIANIKPKKTSELLSIKGMGGKAKRFANEILKVLNFSGVQISQDELQRADYESLSTQEKTMFLYSSGRSVNEIARDRKITTETVLSHLAKFISSGKVDIFQLIEADKLKALSSIIRENPTKTDKEIITEYNKKYSYSEIKITREYLKQD